MNADRVALLFTIATIAFRGGVKAEEHLAGDDLFKEGRIPGIRIELSPAATDRLRQHPRTYVRGIVREGDLVYTNVAIRLKGGPGSFRPVDDPKPAFTVNFGRVAAGQRFHGLKKLHLNNSVQDHTYLAEKISRELFEAAGVPAPRAGHVAVQFNGRDLGLYVLVEGIDKHFLKRYFKDAGGNLYDGHSQSDVTSVMRTNSGEDRRDQSRLRALAAAAQEPDLDQRWAALKKTLDVERFISFLAVEVMTCHWDGYAMNRNNFRIYHDRGSDRMVFLPQGVDQTFQRLNTQLFPPMSGLVAKAVLEIPQARKLYHERMTQLLTNVFQAAVVRKHLTEVASKVQPVLVDSNPAAAASYQNQVAGFARRIQQRANSLERQLLPPSFAAGPEGAGILPLPAWEPKIEMGNPVLTREREKEGKTLLHIATTENCSGSWRTKVLLDGGQYRLEGRVRLQGVKLDAEDPKAGAGLRISRRKPGRKLSGDMEWTTTAFDFEVRQDHMDVELVCELRAVQGQAWFDLGSLRLIRRE